MPDPVLLVEDVWKRYGRVYALRGASLTLEKGEILGLLGPNGAGKTTLLKVVLGLARRDRGRVELLGRDPLVSPDARRGVGVVFERPTLPDSIPVRELLEYAARIHGTGRRAVDEAIAVAGLEGHEWKRFDMLSAGLKQRAAIAHAMVAEPEVLVADEPTSNLDPVERARILDLLAGLNARMGLTILVSSHVVSEVLRVSTRLAVMGAGRVRAYGRPDEVLGGFKTARVRASDPGLLARLLEDAGYSVRVHGVSVDVALEGPEGARRLFAALSRVDGVRVYSVDLVEPGLEEVLGGAAEETS